MYGADRAHDQGRLEDRTGVERTGGGGHTLTEVARIARARRRLADAQTPAERQKAQRVLDALLADAPHWALPEDLQEHAAEPRKTAQAVQDRRPQGAEVPVTHQRELGRGSDGRGPAIGPSPPSSSRYPVPAVLLHLLHRAYTDRPRHWDSGQVVEAVLAGWHYLRRSDQERPPDHP